MVIILDLLGAFCAVFLLVQVGHASALDDFYIQQAVDHYFSLPQDARSLSMGGSEALACGDSSCIYLNPAGLGMLSQFEFAATLGGGDRSGNEFLSDEQIEQIQREGYGVLAIPLGHTDRTRPRFGTIEFGYSRYQGHTDDAIRTSPDGHRRTVAYGYAPLDTLALGYMFTFYDDQLHSELADLHSTSRFLHVFGIQLRPAEFLTIGSVFKLGIGQSDTEDFLTGSNGLSHLKQYTGAFDVKTRFDDVVLGLGFDYSALDSEGNLGRVSGPVVIGGDEDGDRYNFQVGAQFEVLQHFFLRTGFRYQRVHYKFFRPDLSKLSGSSYGPGWSGGLGYIWKWERNPKLDLRLDYGFEYSLIGHGDWEHLFTIAVPFDIV